MKVSAIKNLIPGGVHKVIFKMKDHSPEILVVGGVAAMTVAAVWACRKTLEVPYIMETTRAELDELNEYDGEISEKRYASEKRGIQIRCAGELAKTYAGPVALGAVGIAGILSGHKLRLSRYLEAAAAWAASQADYKALLERIKRDYGEDEAFRLKHDVQETVETTLDEDKEETKTYATPTVGTLYSRFFDESNVNWMKDPFLNMKFLLKVQEDANKTLEKRGFLYLNEVLNALGFDQSAHLSEAGWVRGAGDGIVDFGIFDNIEDNPRKAAFINGYERSILLDFNCVGRIREYV